MVEFWYNYQCKVVLENPLKFINLLKENATNSWPVQRRIIGIMWKLKIIINMNKSKSQRQHLRSSE